MPGNRAIFDRAMEGYRDAAQREDWLQAVRESIRAVQQFPTDLEARTAMAVGLYHTGKYTQAVQLLEELRTRGVNDPLTLAYLARSYEGAQQVGPAVTTLVELGDLSVAQRRLPEAVDAYEDALRLQADREDLRLKLAQVLVDVGDTIRAAEQCVSIAQGRHAAGDTTGALEALDEALTLDRANRVAQTLRRELTRTEPAPKGTTGSLVRGDQRRPGGEAFKDQSLQIDQLMARANQLQTEKDTAGALAMYQKLIEQGVDRPDLSYNLGILLQQVGRHEEAVPYLRKAAQHDEFMLSAYFALGQALQALGNLTAAAAQFEATIRMIDLETIGRAEVDDLIAMYEAAGECYVAAGDLSRGASLYGTLSSFLHTKRWGKELGDRFNERANELTSRSMYAKLRMIGTGSLPALPEGGAPVPEEPATPQVWGTLPSLSDFLQADGAPSVAHTPPPGATSDPWTVPDQPGTPKVQFKPLTPLATAGCSEQVVHLIETGSRYIDQGLLYAATDACLEVMHLDPLYLPIHLRLGHIYERKGRNEEALLKYQTLVDTYKARDNEIEAIDAYYRLVELAPEKATTRSRLAEVLRSANRLDEAVQQSLEVAYNYGQMGQSALALEEFRRLQGWAPRSAPVHLAYGRALLNLERWEAALGEFRLAAQINPHDPIALAFLNLTMAIAGKLDPGLWESLAALIEQVKSDPATYSDVQAAYRGALIITDPPVLYWIFGLIQQHAGEHGPASMSFEQALAKIEPSSGELPIILVHQALAESYIAQGQSQPAIEQLRNIHRLLHEKPVAIDPSHCWGRPLTEIELHRRLAAALVLQGDIAGAISALRTCIRLDPLAVAAYTQLADLYFRQGDLQQAISQYEQLTTVYEQRQLLDQAIATLRDAAKLAPSAIPIRSRLAQLLIRRGLLEPGLHELQEVATLQHNAGQTKDAVLSLQQAADVYWMLGQPQRAYAIYDRIVTTAPDDLDARQQLVNLHILAGRREAAVAEQRIIVRITQQQGNYNEAIAALHQIIALDANDLDAIEQLGNLLMRVKEYDQALRLFRRLERLLPGDERIEALQSAAERMQAMQKAPVA
ncbi:MAG: tetratricopeptide repeat protein [Herpetosiphon sp.]